MAAPVTELKVSRPELIVAAAIIGGARVSAASGQTFKVKDPANDGEIASVPDCAAAEAHAAVRAASAALPDWKSRTAKDRSAIIKRWFALMIENQEDLAKLISIEQGKPMTESRGEVLYSAGYVEWFAEEAKRAYGEVIPEPVRGRKLIVVKEPVGVVATITPWNFPLAMLARKVAPAVAAGCTVVSKPDAATPLSALAFAALGAEAGLPPGVFNVLPASRRHDEEIVGEWMRSSLVRKLSFTGSTAVGKHLMRAAADTLKKISLELGGNAPFLVFDDADLDAAVAGAVAAKFRNSGQTCVCANRILVQDGIYDAFAARLVTAVARLRVGPASQPDAEQGPLIHAQALAKVESHLEDALAHGAKLLTGGHRHPLGHNFFEPTVLAEMTPAMKIAREETFGPIAPLFRFHDEAEALAMANDSQFGLAAYFYSRDIGRIWRIAAGLEAGMVGINEGIISTEVAPFGGVKESGFGREGARQGLDEYLNLKYLCMGGLN